MQYYCFDALLLKEGWMKPAYVGIQSGVIRYLSGARPDATEPIEHVEGYALPGFINAHSHAFQYAMAGIAEQHNSGTNDDFWSWRETMYQCALSVTPEQMEAVASMAYAEMLRNGYTHVVEFHYVHHDQAGNPYSNVSEMGERLLRAANASGVRITLAPVLYQKGNFGTAPYPQQRRFICRDTDEYLQLLDDSATAVSHYPHAGLAFGVHSLRAAEAESIKRVYEEGPPLPFHMHAAEQRKEINDCRAYLGATPVEWLLQNLPVENRFHLVHCTHMTTAETQRLAASGAHVVLCPGTEANLGDGIFPLTEFASYRGKWSLGTDSHISLNPLEDIRWMDYAQRLTTHKRNTFDDGAQVIIDQVLQSGREAAGISDYTNYFETGSSFDAVVYDSHAPLLARASMKQILPSIVYTADSSAVVGTIVGGDWKVRRGMHVNQESIRQSFGTAVKKIFA